MGLKYLVDSQYIPQDDSQEVIKKFVDNTKSEVLIFPDVHMKKGALIANGMLVSSDFNIYLSCLGVENCGYTFGKINEHNQEKLVQGFAEFSKILRERVNIPKYSTNEILDLFDKYLRLDYEKKEFLYKYLGFNNAEDLILMAHQILDSHIIKMAANTLCTLGGGNHFFELHKITNVYDSDRFNNGDFIYMLHSDSISVGDTIYELFSDLHEMKGNNSLRARCRILKFRFYQYRYFRKLCKSINGIKNDLHLIFNPKNDYQAIDVRTELGRVLMTAHNLSSVFGEMNRDAIINLWAETQGIVHEKMGSHSHDNVTAELNCGAVKIVHRNGVQNIGNDEYCILPSAMGNYSYVMKNAYNEEAYFSTNHGTGRMQDKHIARDEYTESMTKAEMEKAKVSLFRVGNGNLAEQNMHAFKDPTAIVNEMERFKLARKAAKTQPVAVIKG